MAISTGRLRRGSIIIPLLEDLAANTTESALMLHGIFSEKTEDGRYDRLTEQFRQNETSTWRIDFIGHGESDVASRDFTVAGAMADFLTAAEAHRRAFPTVSRVLVASSFGGSVVLLAAVSGLLEQFGYRKIILLNPVIDYKSSFLEPFGEQMQEIFTPERLITIRTEGEAEVQPGFYLTLPVVAEFAMLHPAPGLNCLSSPTLIVQGDRDTAVSPDLTAQACANAPKHVTLEMIPGAAHAFADPTNEAISFRLIRDFLAT